LGCEACLVRRETTWRVRFQKDVLSLPTEEQLRLEIERERRLIESTREVDREE
jgi:hypothetical protein